MYKQTHKILLSRTTHTVYYNSLTDWKKNRQQMAKKYFLINKTWNKIKYVLLCMGFCVGSNEKETEIKDSKNNRDKG